MIGEWSPWDADDPGFVARLHEWVESHRRAQMLVYFQGFGDPNPFQIQRYPGSAEELEDQLDLDRYIEQAPDTHRPEGDGHSRFGPDGVPMPRRWRQILEG